MRKQEYIHIHGLLSEVENYLEEKDYHLDRELDLEEYESLGVRPTSVHKSKTDHREAIFTLSDAIVDYLEEGRDEQGGAGTGKAAGD